MSDKPEALRIADELDGEVIATVARDVMHNDAANELRRLHAANIFIGNLNAEAMAEIKRLSAIEWELMEELAALSRAQGETK